MAIDPDDHDSLEHDPLMDRAAQELREEETPSWAKASTAILSALRATTRRTRMVNASFPEAAEGDSLLVADHVVKLGIVRATADLPCTIRGIDLDIDERDVTGLTVEIAVTYGEDMRALAVEVADRAAESVNSDFGHTVDERDISVSIVDVSLP